MIGKCGVPFGIQTAVGILKVCFSCSFPSARPSPERLHRGRRSGACYTIQGLLHLNSGRSQRRLRSTRTTGYGRQPRFPIAADSRRWRAGLLPRRTAYGRCHEVTLLPLPDVRIPISVSRVAARDETAGRQSASFNCDAASLAQTADTQRQLRESPPAPMGRPRMDARQSAAKH